MARSIEVKILGDASNFTRELKTAEGSTSKFGGTLNTMKMAAVGAGIGGLAVLGKFMLDSVAAAEGAQAAHERLEQAFKNVGLSSKDFSKQIDDAESSMRKLGFTDTNTETALGSLVTATGNTKKAMFDLGVAADLARFKHVDLETATKNLTAAMGGSQRAIKQLGIVVAPVTTAVDKLKASHEDLTTAAGKADLAQAKLQDKMATGQEVIQKTSELVKGQGQAYADTAAGGMAQFSAQLDHLQVALARLSCLVLGLPLNPWRISSITSTSFWNHCTQ